jgi:diketogulonate reductase-like aldo/keto reductase
MDMDLVYSCLWSMCMKEGVPLPLQAIVPRSSKRDRIAANRQLAFVLSDSQMRRIDELDGTMHPQSE